jgi:hypothetical protein
MQKDKSKPVCENLRIYLRKSAGFLLKVFPQIPAEKFAEKTQKKNTTC